MHDLVLDQHRQGGSTHVQQGNKEQGPSDRRSRACHRRRRVVAREQVGQPCSAHHQAKHEGQEVAPRVLKVLALLGCAVRIADEGLAVARQPTQRTGTLVVLNHFARPALARLGLIARHGGQLAAGRNNQAHIGIVSTQLVDTLARRLALARQGRADIKQPALVLHATLQVGAHHLVLGLGQQQLLFHPLDLADLLAIDQCCQWRAKLLVGQPRHRDQKRQQHHHILRYLRPGDGAHATEEGAQQHTAQAEHDADLELHPREARSDQPHTINLRHHIGERTQHGRQGCDHARPAPAKTHLEKIRNGVQIHRPQVRRDEHGHEHEAPGPAQYIGQATRLAWRTRKALQVQRTAETDERGRTHPVGSGGHAVVHGRYTPPGHVVLLGIRGTAIHANASADHHHDEKENRPDPVARQATLLGPGHQRQKA